MSTFPSTNSNSPSTLDALLFPISTFLLSIATLTTSTSTLISSTTHLSHKLRIPESLISLLTAGLEWEELAVIVASVATHHPRLALGNILGSCIANILGAFSLGVLAQRENVVSYDASARIYAVVLFGITTFVAVLWGFGRMEGLVCGVVLVVMFGGYVVGVGWSIYRGVLDAPEDSDAESDDEEEEESDGHGREGQQDEALADESTPLTRRRRKQASTLMHLGKLMVAVIALSLSGYVLSHSSQALASQFKISDTVFGATLLSFATTLPEKFLAVVSGYRGHPGIMVASTVGSNIFLLTLCLGITILSSQDLAETSSYTQEIVWTWTSSALLMVMIIIGTHRLVGLAMLLAYIAFLVLEFKLYRL